MTIFKNTSIMLLVMLTLASCAAMTGRETPGEYAEDAAITAKIKTAIVKDSNLKAAEIHVETFQRDVQLSGFVASKAEAARAARHARAVKDVRYIDNDLVVRKHHKKM